MPAMWSPIATLPETRQGILVALRRRGELSIEEITAEMRITPSAIRQQLTALINDGFIARRIVPIRRGRPRHFYRLTDAADAFFPGLDLDMVVALSVTLARGDSEFTDAWRNVSAPIGDGLRERLPGRPFTAQVAELGAVFGEHGFLSDIDVKGAEGRVSVYSCPLRKLAMEFPVICQLEMSDIQVGAEGAEVTRATHMLDGQPTCDYVLRARPGRVDKPAAEASPAA